MSERSCITVFAAVAFAACGGGGGIEIPTGGPQGGVNIQVCATSGTTGNCLQGATNTNISGPVGAGNLPPAGGGGGPSTPGQPDLSFLPENLRREVYDPENDVDGPFYATYGEALAEDFPSWSDSIIEEAPAGISGAGDVADETLLAALGDSHTGGLSWVEWPRGKFRARTAVAAYRVQRWRGLIRSVHFPNDEQRSFASSPPTDSEKAAMTDSARTVCQSYIGDAFDQETVAPVIKTVLQHAINVQDRKHTRRYGDTRIIFQRVINDRFVLRSSCSVVFDAERRILNTFAEWPAFRLCESATVAALRDPEAVKQDIISRASDIHQPLPIHTESQVVYARAINSFSVCYLPAVVSKFLTKPEVTPYAPPNPVFVNPLVNF